MFNVFPEASKVGKFFRDNSLYKSLNEESINQSWKLGNFRFFIQLNGYQKAVKKRPQIPAYLSYFEPQSSSRNNYRKPIKATKYQVHLTAALKINPPTKNRMTFSSQINNSRKEENVKFINLQAINLSTLSILFNFLINFQGHRFGPVRHARPGKSPEIKSTCCSSVLIWMWSIYLRLPYVTRFLFKNKFLIFLDIFNNFLRIVDLF
jgi:hypothetical protein